MGIKNLLGLTKDREKKEEAKTEDLTKIRDAKCEPVAEQILKLIGVYGMSAANKVDYAKSLEMNGPLASSINQIFKDGHFTITDCAYTWSIVQSMLDTVRDFSHKAIQASFDLAQAKVFNVDEISELTLQEIDDVLQS